MSQGVVSKVPSVAASESSHDCRAPRADLRWSGSSRILSLRQHLEDKFLAPSWPPSVRAPSLDPVSLPAIR
jgi:hypothetical protein